MPQDLKEVVLELGTYMLKLAGKGDNIEENKTMMLKNIENGKAYSKFKEMVQNQGGNIEYLENTDMFEKSKYIILFRIVPTLAAVHIDNERNG